VRDWRKLDLLDRAFASPHAFSGLTDSEGKCTLPTYAVVEPADQYFLWVTHPQFTANWAAHSLSAEGSRNHISITLGPPRHLQVEVSSGAQAAGSSAWVIQTLSFYGSASGPGQGFVQNAASENAAREAMVRIHQAAPPTPLLLQQFEHESHLQAVAPGARSAVRVVVPNRDRLRLPLHATFFLRGLVTCDDLSRAEEASLALISTVGQSRDVLAEYSVKVGSQFGPIEVPLVTSGTIHAVASTRCGGTRAVALGEAAPGQTLYAEFPGRPIPESWFRVVDLSNQPIGDAVVSASWFSEGVWISQDGLTNKDGFCSVNGIGVDRAFVTARHLSYASQEGIECAAYQPKSAAPMITLSPGRNISGRVLLDGEPAESFTISVWRDDPQVSASFSFVDRAQGSFELPGTSIEELHLMAAGASMSSSPITIIPAGELDIGEVVIHCAAAGSLRIQVVDSATGKSVESASVQQRPAAGRIGLSSTAPELMTDSQGIAQFKSFSCTETVVLIDHPEYSERSVLLPEVAPGTTRDPLRISIDRLKRLEVRLRPWPPAEWETAWVRIGGSGQSKFEEVTSGGSMDFGLVPVGPLDLYVVFPDSTTVSWEGYLLPGDDGIIVIDLETTNTLDVLLDGHDVEVDQQVICEYVAIREAGPAFSLRTLMNEDRRAQLRGLPDGVGLVRVSLGDGTEIAERVITREILDSGQLTIEPRTHSIDVLVVDAEGVPVPNVYVYAAADHAPIALYDWAQSDESGAATIARSGETPSKVFASAGARLSAIHRHDPADVSSDGITLKLIDTVEVNFTAPGAGVSAPEVLFNLHLASPRLWVAEISTLLSQQVSPGNYLVVLRTPGLWLDEEIIQVPPSGGVVPIRVRRQGALAVAPLGGLSLEAVQLTDLLDNQSSEDRLARGRISRVSLDGGGFEFRGLPCGEYRWTARFTDGLERSGTVHVAPDTRTTLEIARE
jgi:hypothetical protein